MEKPIRVVPAYGDCPIEMMEYLANRSTKVEEQQFLGTTSLHWACRFGRINEVEILIDQGANVSQIGRKFRGKSESSLQLTRDPKIAHLLKSHGAS